MDRLSNPVIFAATMLGSIDEPHPGQCRYLLDQTHQTKVLAAARRSGKTTAIAIEVIYHVALALRSGRPCRQLLVAPAVDQAKLAYTTVKGLLVSSPLGGIIESDKVHPFPELQLAGGSVIFVRAATEGGKLLRGHQADRVVCDESAWLPDTVIEESIGPILADSGGTLVLSSSPAATGSLFHRLFEQGRGGSDPQVASYTMKTLDNPHVDRGYVEAQRESLTERQFRTEYEGQFCDQGGAVFKWEHIAACIDGDMEWANTGQRISIGWDPARVNDRSGVVAVDAGNKPLRVIHVEDVRGDGDLVDQVHRVAELARGCGAANTRVTVDCTGIGSTLVDLLRREGIHVVPFTFTATTKAELVTTLAAMIEKHAVILPSDRALLDELRFFVAMPAGASGRIRFGPQGSKAFDDLTTALALAVHGAGGSSGHRSFAECQLPPLLTSSGAGIPGWVADHMVSKAGDLPDSWGDVEASSGGFLPFIRG